MSTWQLSSIRLCLLDDPSQILQKFDEIYFQITQISGEHTFSSLVKREGKDIFFDDKVNLNFENFQSVSSETPQESKTLKIRFFSYHQNDNTPLAFSNLQTSKHHTQIFHGSSNKYLGQLYYSLIEMSKENQQKLFETPNRLNVLLNRSAKNPKSSLMVTPFSKQEKKHLKAYSCITQQDFEFSGISQTQVEKYSVFRSKPDPIHAKTPLNKFLYSAYFENDNNLNEIQKPNLHTEQNNSKQDKSILTQPNLEFNLYNTSYSNTDPEYDLSLNPKQILKLSPVKKNLQISKVEDILQISSTKASTTATEFQQSDSQREQRSLFLGDLQKQLTILTKNNIKSTDYEIQDTYLPVKLSSEIAQINRSSSIQQVTKKDSLSIANPSSTFNLPPKSQISSTNQAVNTVAQFPISGTQNSSNTILQRQRSAASITIQQFQKQPYQITANQQQYQSQNLFPRRLSNAQISPSFAPNSSPFLKTTPNQIPYHNINQPSMINNSPCLSGNNNYIQAQSSIPMYRQPQQLQTQLPQQLSQFNPYSKNPPFKISIGSNSFF